MNKLLLIFSVLLLQINAFASDIEIAREKTKNIFGKSIMALHEARGTLSTLLNLDPFVARANLPHEALPMAELPVDVIRIEIRNNHILYKIGEKNAFNDPAYFWIYETYLHFDGETWPLHEFPKDSIYFLETAQDLEFTYGGRSLLLPEGLKQNILAILKAGHHSYECHSFKYSATKNFEFEEGVEVTFDRSIVEELGIIKHPNSGSSNWVHSMPMISLKEEGSAPLDISRANPGAYFYFGRGCFGNGHSAIEIGPDLILSKLGSAGLTVAPIKSLAYNYVGDLLIKEMKGISLERRMQRACHGEEGFPRLSKYLSDNFYNIKALDEYERENALLSFTDPKCVATKVEYMGLWHPGYEISVHEKFKFWLLDRIRESDNFEHFIERNQNAIKRFMRISPTEKKWFDEKPLYSW